MALANRHKKSIYHSKHHNWHSPPKIVQGVLRAFNLQKFALDPATTDHNIPAEIDFTEKEDGLKQPWATQGHIWLNPPYGTALKKFVQKAVDHVEQNPQVVIWLLIPVRTANKYYQQLFENRHAFTIFLDGKLAFGDNGQFGGNSAIPQQLTCLTRNLEPTLSHFLTNREAESALRGTVFIPQELIADEGFPKQFRVIKKGEQMVKSLADYHARKGIHLINATNWTRNTAGKYVMSALVDKDELNREVIKPDDFNSTMLANSGNKPTTSTTGEWKMPKQANYIDKKKATARKAELLQVIADAQAEVDFINKLLGTAPTAITPKAKKGGKGKKMSPEARKAAAKRMAQRHAAYDAIMKRDNVDRKKAMKIYTEELNAKKAKEATKA